MTTIKYSTVYFVLWHVKRSYQIRVVFSIETDESLFIFSMDLNILTYPRLSLFILFFFKQLSCILLNKKNQWMLMSDNCTPHVRAFWTLHVPIISWISFSFLFIFYLRFSVMDASAMLTVSNLVVSEILKRA